MARFCHSYEEIFRTRFAAGFQAAESVHCQNYPEILLI